MTDFSLLGGLLLGLASSLHCAGMCGGIASGLLFAFAPAGSGGRRAATLLVAQAGRITAYVGAGAFLGAVGSEFYGAFDHAAAHLVLRWAAAVALGWIGLSMLGFAPALSRLDRLAAPIGRVLAGSGRLAMAGGLGGSYAAGLAWGFLPCGMVYGALFYAMLAGSGPGGAQVMAGFGLGTVPAVVATAFGVTQLRRLSASKRLRASAGLALIAVAAASVLLPANAWQMLCIT